jgi:hypothetical protein
MSPENFWNWFAANATRIAANPSDTRLIKELDQRIFETWPQLAWEIGPDSTGDWYFALSPNINRELAITAQEAIREAPSVSGWKFYPTRQRKTWNGIFEMEAEGRNVAFNSAHWKYVLLRYPDGETEVVFTAPESSSLQPEDRWQAAAIVVEGLLGEQCLLEHVTSFALEPELDERLLAQAKPAHLLPQAFGLH